MDNKEFTKLCNLVVATDCKLDGLAESKSDKSNIDHVLNTLDAVLGKVDEVAVERLAADAQLDRHGRWIDEVARATGVRYPASE